MVRRIPSPSSFGKERQTVGFVILMKYQTGEPTGNFMTSGILMIFVGIRV
jgi:hypothetical protein